MSAVLTDRGATVLMLREVPRRLLALLSALEETRWAPGETARLLAERVLAELPDTQGAGAGRVWRPGALALAVMAADALRLELRDETWALVATLAAESNLADAGLLAAKAFAGIWNRTSDRAALDQAVDLAARAADVAGRVEWKAEECDYWHAMLLSQRATAGQSYDDLDRAIVILHSLSERAPGDHRYWYRLASTLLTRNATARRADGDLDAAVNAAQRALETGPRDPDWRTSCLHVLAEARRARWRSPARHGDDLDLALQDIASEIKAEPEPDPNLLALAIRVLRQRWRSSCAQSGDLKQAVRYAECLAVRVGSGDPDASDHWRTLAMVEADRWDLSRDSSHLNRGIDFAERAASPRDDPSRVLQRGNLLASLLVARAGSTARQSGDLARAESLARRAETSPIPEIALSSMRVISRVRLAKGDWPMVARSAHAALDLLADLAKKTGPEVVEDWLAVAQGMAALGSYGLARHGDAAGAALLCERGTAIIAANTGTTHNPGSGARPPKPIEAPNDRVVVQLVVTPIGAVALLTRPGEPTAIVDLPALTDDEVTRWCNRLSQPGRPTSVIDARGDHIPDPVDVQAVLEQMTGALEPLCRRLATQRVRLVPVGAVAGLPISAVIETASGSPVSVAGSVALHARAAAASKLPASAIRALAVTSPSPCTVDDKLLPALPGATAEGKWLAGCESCTLVRLDGPQATRARVLAALGTGIDLAHFGTHGRFDPDNPLRSALYLTDGADGAAETLSPAELTGPAAVTLACCTLGAAGRRLPDEHQGFNSALLSAGAWFVLSPLWAVDDAATTDFMTIFYEQLFEGGDPAAALRDARARTQQRHGTRSPCWASWVLAGG